MSEILNKLANFFQPKDTPAQAASTTEPKEIESSPKEKVTFPQSSIVPTGLKHAIQFGSRQDLVENIGKMPISKIDFNNAFSDDFIKNTLLKSEGKNKYPVQGKKYGAKSNTPPSSYKNNEDGTDNVDWSSATIKGGLKKVSVDEFVRRLNNANRGATTQRTLSTDPGDYDIDDIIERTKDGDYQMSMTMKELDADPEATMRVIKAISQMYGEEYNRMSPDDAKFVDQPQQVKDILLDVRWNIGNIKGTNLEKSIKSGDYKTAIKESMNMGTKQRAIQRVHGTSKNISEVSQYFGYGQTEEHFDKGIAQYNNALDQEQDIGVILAQVADQIDSEYSQIFKTLKNSLQSNLN